jgi:hypothetical protein
MGIVSAIESTHTNKKDKSYLDVSKMKLDG